MSSCKQFVITLFMQATSPIASSARNCRVPTSSLRSASNPTIAPQSRSLVSLVVQRGSGFSLPLLRRSVLPLCAREEPAIQLGKGSADRNRAPEKSPLLGALAVSPVEPGKTAKIPTCATRYAASATRWVADQLPS
jgi:hypothetical protein